jgi:hypothetical protein
MTDRKILPNRRGCETFEIKHADRIYQVTIGRFPEGTIGEVFVTGAKVGSAMEAVARDAAVCVSIALQYGVPLTILRHAVTREQDASPSSIIGAVLDQIGETENAV